MFILPFSPPPQVGYGLGRGRWAQTASIDWCESNYEISYYIAEFWNTISNLAFIIPQLVQYVALSKYDNIEFSFKSAYLSLILVGIGSFCFHMTLEKSMQMFDETSMIIVTLHGFYLLYLIKQPNVNIRRLTSLLVCYALVFLSMYVFLVEQPAFHHTTFAIVVYASIILGYRLKRIYGGRYTFWTVMFLQHLGLIFWVIDKKYCDVLTTFRNNHVPGFLRPIFQFHALWHLFMGLGSHIYICSLIRLRAWTEHKEEFVISYKWFQLIKLDTRRDQKIDNTNLLQSLHHTEQRQVTETSPGPKYGSKQAKHRQNRYDISKLDLNQNQIN